MFSLEPPDFHPPLIILNHFTVLHRHIKWGLDFTYINEAHGFCNPHLVISKPMAMGHPHEARWAMAQRVHTVLRGHIA